MNKITPASANHGHLYFGFGSLIGGNCRMNRRRRQAAESLPAIFRMAKTRPMRFFG
jgi:hypothetical protein